MIRQAWLVTHVFETENYMDGLALKVFTDFDKAKEYKLYMDDLQFNDRFNIQPIVLEIEE